MPGGTPEKPEGPPPATRAASCLPRDAAPGDATIAESPVPETEAPASGPGLVDPSKTSPLEETAFERRYAVRAPLGTGGMGEVHLCRDHLVGREVAMKVVRRGTGSQPGIEPRFVREARIQGQLEHPAVVPVYDLGIAPDGTTFFTMKRVRGMTLAEVLDGVRRGDPDLLPRYSRRKLLTAMSGVCLAVDFAHSRGVVHRDLKPSNVMLGDFGEVYLLDWGLAKIATSPEPAEPSPAEPPPQTEIQTLRGTLLGTPGYMAPEQLLEPASADARADVYALGAILFEILTLEPLHPRDSTPGLLASTLAGADARASARSPDRDVPPELDAICVRATARDPADRYPTARELHEAVERYLDGDRDLALRRQLAAEHARAAEAAAGRALGGGPDAHDERAQAMREVSRALALDPENAGALRTMVSLLVEPPREVPPEVRAELTASAMHHARLAARIGSVAYLLLFVTIPFFLWMGIRDWIMGAACLVLGTAAIGLTYVISRRAEPAPALLYFVLALATLAIVVTSRMFGPFFFLPCVALANTIGFVMTPPSAARPLFIASGCLAIALPAALEWAGVLPPSYVFQGGTLTVLPQMHGLAETPTVVFLLLANLAIVVVAGLAIGRIFDALTSAEQRLQLHAWHFRQLLPQEARGAVEGRPPAPVLPPGAGAPPPAAPAG